jgi:hypothetical protein
VQDRRVVLLPTQHSDVIVHVYWGELAAAVAAVALAVWLLRRRGRRRE